MVLAVNPAVGQADRMALRIAPLGELRGRVIGILDNSKRNFGSLADDMAHILERDFGVASVMRRSKSNPVEAAPSAIIEELAANCDLVITGSGD